MSIAGKLMTAAEFAQLPVNSHQFELVRGELVEMNRPKPKHGKILFRIARIVGDFIDEHDLGHWFGGDAGIVTEKNPDSVRGPDAAYASYKRIPPDADDEIYFLAAPELVFEVLSPSDRWVETLDKVAEYLHAGVDVVCVVDPKTKSVQLHRADSSPATLTANDSFEIADILPGFSCQIADFFPHRKNS